MTIGSDTSFTT